MAARHIQEFAGDLPAGAIGGAPQAPAADPAREKLFKAAYRHSRRVRRLRVLVPVAALLLAGVVGLVSWWDPLKALNLPVSISGLSMSGSRVTMEAPRLTGYTNDNRFYRVSATRAEHDITQTNVVALSAIDAEMELEGGDKARIISPAGVLDTKTGTVELNQRVQVSTTSGQRGELGHALVDTRAGTIRSNGPVALASPRGELFADTMAISDNGKVIVLEGHVRGNFMPEPPDPTITDLSAPTPAPR